ncbi:MAG: PQQ-binding-like beta-propeller repeat protein [Verrucomicrobiota bacterium]
MRFPREMLGCALATALAVGHGLQAADWPQWRGPGREDRSDETGLLKSWPAEGPKQLWVNSDAGLGYAGVAVVGSRLYTMGLRDQTEHVIALDVETGKQAWAVPVGPRYENNWGDGPRMTPTVVDGRIYALGARGDLVCLNAKDGSQAWTKSLVKDLGGKLQDWGYTESPLVHNGLVYCTPGGANGTMAALDALTGAVAWRTKDITDTAQYSSPILAKVGGKEQVVQLVMKRFFGVDPKTGAVAWNIEFPGRVAVIPTPIVHDDVAYVTAGYGVGCKAVRWNGSAMETLYEDNKVMKNHHGGVIRMGDHLYGHSDGYGWVCQELKTGKEAWVHKGFGKGAVHYADGHLYCVDEGSGAVALVEVSTQGWKQKGQFKLSPQTTQRKPQGRIWVHPVVSGGKLFLRDQELLHCYDVKGH